jgi:hypothetical protein
MKDNATSGKLDIKIEGALAGLLSLALGSKHKNGLSTDTQAFDRIGELVLVAGGCNRRNLPSLRCLI